MTGPEATAAMKAEDVDPALVEAACRARWDTEGSVFTGHFGDVARTWDALAALFPAEAEVRRTVERHTLAAVLPEIQAQALRDAADRLHARTDGVNREGTKGWPERHREVYAHAIDEASDALREDAARLTDTTEETPT